MAVVSTSSIGTGLYRNEQVVVCPVVAGIVCVCGGGNTIVRNTYHQIALQYNLTSGAASPVVVGIIYTHYSVAARVWTIGLISYTSILL